MPLMIAFWWVGGSRSNQQTLAPWVCVAPGRDYVVLTSSVVSGDGFLAQLSVPSRRVAPPAPSTSAAAAAPSGQTRR